MEKTCQYYWDKVAIAHFSNLSDHERMELAEAWLSKDELAHFKELLEK